MVGIKTSIAPIGSCSIVVDFSHNFNLNTLIKKSMTTDSEFLVLYFSSLKRERYLMGVIILICYIFLFSFSFFSSSSCFVSAQARELLIQIYQSVVPIYLLEKPDVFL